MDTEIDWQRELDSSFGSGADVPAGHYVAAGHRAVRRRRAVSVAIVVAMTVGAGAAWGGPGTTPRGDAPVATQPASPHPDDPTEKSEDAAQRKRSLTRMRDMARNQAVQFDNPVALTQDGELVLAPGEGPVLEEVPNPMGYTAAQGHSVGVRVMKDGKEQYGFLTVYPNSSSATMVWKTGDFAGWLAQAVRSQSTLDVANGVTPASGDISGMPWLALSPGGEIEAARPGVVIVELRTDVDLGGNFGQGATRAGVVRLLVDGRSEFAAFTVWDDELNIEPAGGTFESMSAFITWATAQYATGDGMR
ncbi:hypothetical protein [Nocardioides lacusdianchii]|uniref:hypothetical protein n=1 Tax=Nocardioides lacusdianchii TaxID=2783664 RepID=UPI001CCD30CE|nr:hypothetical protein [Nocardioides lacusdianchii]